MLDCILSQNRNTFLLYAVDQLVSIAKVSVASMDGMCENSNILQVLTFDCT